MITKTKAAVIVSRLLKNKEAALCRFCLERCPHEQCKGMCAELELYHEELLAKVKKKKELIAKKIKVKSGGVK